MTTTNTKPTRTQRPQGTVIFHRDTNTSDIPGLNNQTIQETRHYSLTEARTVIRGARTWADTFHTYTTTDRQGRPIHIAYAHYERGTCPGPIPYTKTWIWEISTDALLDSFGLLPIDPNGADQ